MVSANQAPPGRQLGCRTMPGEGGSPYGSGASRDFRPFGVLSQQNYCRDHFRKRSIFRDFATCNRTSFLILTRKSEVVSADAPQPTGGGDRQHGRLAAHGRGGGDDSI